MADELITAVEPIASDPAPVVDAPVVDNTDSVLGDAYDRLTKEYTRDDAGRFAADGSKIVSPDAPSVAQDDGAGDVAAVPPVAGVSAPAHLPQAIKAEWGTMTETARTAVAAHQAEMDRKFGEVGRQLETVKPFADTLSQAMKQIPELAGMNPHEMAQAALHLAAVQSDLGKNPVGTLLGIIEAYGVGDQLKSVLNGTEYQAPANQGTAALERQIADLKAQIQRTSDPETIRTEISKTMKEKDAEAVLQKFVAGDGKEHWADVEADVAYFVGKILGSGRQMTQEAILSEAYSMAINANPEVRAKVEAARAKAMAAAPDPKRADAARKAVSINIKPVANGKDAPRSDEEAMSMAYDRAMAN